MTRKSIVQMLTTPKSNAQNNKDNEENLGDDILSYIKGKGDRVKLGDICKKFNLSSDEAIDILNDLHKRGYDIIDDSNILDTEISLIRVPLSDHNFHSHELWSGNPIRLGLISDTHLGIAPQYSAEAELADALKRLRDKGVNTIIHAGDITHGVNSRHKGLQYEMADGVVGADDQVDYVVNNYPRIDGLRTFFITGSHDLWVYNSSGFDVGRAIASQRDDMIYIGQEKAHIFVGPEEQTRITIHHPTGGSAYSISYKPQKLVEAMIGGEKPHVYILGHYHRFGIFRPRNVITVMVPGFQWGSPFYTRTGLEPEVGAIYVELDLSTSGSILAFRFELMPYYRESALPSNVS